MTRSDGNGSEHSVAPSPTAPMTTAAAASTTRAVGWSGMPVGGRR